VDAFDVFGGGAEVGCVVDFVFEELFLRLVTFCPRLRDSKSEQERRAKREGWG